MLRWLAYQATRDLSRPPVASTTAMRCLQGLSYSSRRRHQTPVSLRPPGGARSEPLVHAPEAVQSAGIGGVGVMDDAVLEHERTHAHGSPNASPRTLTQTATRRRYHVRPPACQSLHSANQAEWPGGVWRTAETHRALDHLGFSHYAPSFVMTGSGVRIPLAAPGNSPDNSDTCGHFRESARSAVVGRTRLPRHGWDPALFKQGTDLAPAILL